MDTASIAESKNRRAMSSISIQLEVVLSTKKIMRTQVGIVTNAMPDSTYEIGFMLPVSYVSQVENIEETDTVQDNASQFMENNA